MRTATSLILPLVAFLALAGCSGDDPGQGPDDAAGPSQTQEPSGDDPATEALAGDYQVVTQVDLGSDAFASDDLVSLLQKIKDAPITTTVLAGAEDLGIPESVISSIESFLGGALPDGFADTLDGIATGIDEAMGNFEVVSELHINAGDGAVAATHTVTGIDITFGGIHTFVDVSAYTEPVEVVVTRDGDGISVSQHDLPVPVGVAISDILDGPVAQNIAADAEDLGDALAIAADCESLGTAWGLFDEGYLTSICEAGTDKVAAGLHAALEKLDTVDIDMTLSGSAALSDDNADGAFDMLEGAWDHGGDALPFVGERM